MDKLEPPAPLQLTGNVSENWKKFKQRFNLYLSASGADEKEDKQKSCLLLHVIGEDALEIYNNFTFTAGDEYKLDKILEKFQAYCTPKKNVTYERHRFFTCNQKQGETIDQYVTELRSRSKSCEFGDLTESLIKDRIVCGIPDNVLRERLLREQDLSLEKALTMCRAAETTKTQVKDLNEEKATGHVHVVRQKQKQPKQKYVVNKKPEKKVERKQNFKFSSNLKTDCCGRCDRKHEPGKCPAMGKRCRKCDRLDHFAICCRTKVVNVVENDCETEFFIDSISDDQNKNKTDWLLPLDVNKTSITFKLDTGAQVNILSENDYHKMINKPKLNKTNVKLVGYSGSSIPVLGTCIATIDYKGSQFKIQFVIVKGRAQCILGLKTCDRLNLVKRVLVVEAESQDINTIVNKYDGVFNGLGCLPGEHNIQVDSSVPPVVHACRKVPFALKEKLKDELDRMEALDVIVKEDKPTDWVSSLVIVEKPNGQLRICLDPRDLNKAIKREHYKLPTREEVMAQFSGAKYFSKLDASSGFWQLKLDEESSKLCCFNTPFGRYRFKRLPFGISSAPEVYHKTIHMLFEHVPGTDTSMDDIVVWGSTMDEHNERVEKVLQIAHSNNLKLNRDKCLFGVTELTFLGDVLSADGLKPDPKKQEAIFKMDRPTSKKDVQRFLGMINYLGRFIPDLSTKTAPLRVLLDEKNEFVWSTEQENAWKDLKQIIVEEPVLQYYDPNKRVKISSDASKSGLGAVLLQETDGEWKPVAYASRAMTDAETRYAQIEKEMLSLTFACERFHQYIYGQKVVAETDHKPLVSIVKKPLNMAPLRIQRLLLRIQKYEIELSYTPGKFMFVADALSRAYDKESLPENSSTEADISALVDMVVQTVPMSDQKLTLICEETQKDATMCKLREVILNGWPDEKAQCPYEIREYWNSRDELSVVGEMIMKGDRIVVPAKLRKQMLEKVHEGH